MTFIKVFALQTDEKALSKEQDKPMILFTPS